MLLAPALVNYRALGCHEARTTKTHEVAAACRATNEVINILI
jgi:hypothetical protein